MMNTNRRNFLSILISLGILCFARPAHSISKLINHNPPDDLGSKLADFFVHKESARVVGQEYLRCVPTEGDVQVLVDLICSFRMDWRTKLAKANIRELRELLLYQKRQDFEHGRTVNVRGWILSETEARLCALTMTV